MWKLVSKKTGIPFYLISEKNKYQVGRHNCDLNILDDASISRNHACLIPEEDNIKVVDIGSRYNVYCNENIDNNIPLKKNEPFKLKDGERVKFGRFDSEYVLTKVKIVTAISTLENEEKKVLTKILLSIGGTIADNITPNCTHLTMNSITITTKLLYALFDGIPIVTVKYWMDYLKAAKHGDELPDTTKYIPEIAENFVNINKSMFVFKEERKTLFSNKVFIFLNKKISDRFAPIIEKAGGRAWSLTSNIPIDNLAKPNVIVIHCSTNSQSQEFNKVLDKITVSLKKKKLRIVPEYEIGLALITCSMQKYCNNEFKIENDFLQESTEEKSLQLNKLDVIAEETPNELGKNPVEHLPEVEVPESAVYDLTESDDEERHKANRNWGKNLNSNDIVINLVENEEIFRFCKDLNTENKKPTVNIEILDSSNDEIEIELSQKRKRQESPELDVVVQKNKRLHTSDEVQQEERISASSPVTFKHQNTVESVTKNTEEISKKPKDTETSNLNIPSSSGFYKKPISSKVAKKNEGETSKLSNEKSLVSNKKKRRFAKLGSDSDDDDNDLFNFGNISKNKKKCFNISNSDDDEENSDNENNLFQLKRKPVKNNSTQLHSPNSSNKVTEDIQNTPLNSSRTANSFNNDDSKCLKNTIPRTPTSTTGWLSKEIMKIKIENEKSKSLDTSIDVPESVKIKTEQNNEWIDSIKNFFEVRVNPNLVSSKTWNSDNNDTTNSLNSTGKNFKTFKKQKFIKPKEQIKTEPFHVIGFSF